MFDFDVVTGPTQGLRQAPPDTAASTAAVPPPSDAPRSLSPAPIKPAQVQPAQMEDGNGRRAA